MLFRHAVVIAVAMLLVACSDPKAASEKNFKVAVQKYLEVAYPKCYLFANFPETFDWDLTNLRPKLDAMVKIGLVSVKVEPHEEQDMFGKKITRNMPTYRLTEEGKKYFNENAGKSIAGKPMGAFCFGKATVKNIAQFTEPSDMLGVRVSQVSYTYQVSDLPGWTKLPEIEKAIPEFKADAESQDTPVARNEMVILTNNGWVHQALYKK
jgi:hypothetical protein